MNQPTRLLARLLNAAQRRYRRARPGSVLIMVVSLLVLLALIGTAAMSTARIDRVSSRQNVYNTQVELLADSLKNLIVGQLVDDIFASNGNTGQTDSSSLNPDAGRDSLADVIIGSRLPELLYPYATNSVYTQTPTDIVWHGISYPPIKTSTTVPGTGTRDTVYSFSPPDEEDNTTPTVAAQYALPFYKPTLKPTFKKLNSGDIVPALLPVNVYSGGSFPDLSNSLSRGGTRPFVAGDADGDGIADSLPFKLPMSPIAGVTYYGVVRVVDNSAAININTARAPGFEVTQVMLRSSNTTTPSTSTELSLAGIYPASIDLYKYLDPINVPGTSTNNFNELKQHSGQLLYGNRGFGELVNSSDPSPESITLPPSDTYTDLAHPSRTTYPDAPDNKTPPPGPPANFEFLTYGDAMWHQLGRRLDYPGFVGDPTATPPGRSPVFGGELRPFGVSDAMTLASRFVLANSATTSDSLVEKALFRTTFRNALSFPYKPADSTQAKFDQAVADWFTNFHFGRLPGSARPDSVLNGRPIFTTLNPVRNYVPGEPTLARINPNTATYSELLERYYLVMKEATDDVDQIDVAAGDTGFPYGELLFKNPDDTDKRKEEQKDLKGTEWPKWKKIDNGLNDAMMFRSSLRPPTQEVKLKDTLPPNQMARLRAAIAAVNTIQLRKGLPDDKSPVEAHDVNLTGTPVSGNSNPKQYTARVYGTWRQPFITEVFLHNDTNTNTNSPEGTGNTTRRNPRGFAAIELYNPYDVDISLEDWKIALLTRTPSSSTDALQNAYLSVSYLQKTLVGGPTPAPAAAAAAAPVNNDFIFPADPNCVVPARGYLILWNFEEPVDAAAPPDPDAATWRPGKLHLLKTDPSDTNAVKAYPIKNLHEIIGKEMVLMRPAGSTGPAGGVTEYAPVDSYDSTGMIHHVDIEPDAGLEEWHYSRASKPDNRARDNRVWHCVYPGRYDGGSNKARHQGTEVQAIVKGEDPWGLPGKHPVSGEMNLTFGNGENKNSRDFTLTDPLDVPNTFGIQLAYFDGSISFQRNSNVWTYPGGGFARIGDLLHVTYIGSYVIQDGPASGPPSSSVYEVNPVTIDAAFAEDTDPTTDAYADDNDLTTNPWPIEDIGRFAPLVTDRATSPRLYDLAARVGTGIGQLGSSTTTIADSGRREPVNAWKDYEVVVTYEDKDPVTNSTRVRKAWAIVDRSDPGSLTVKPALPVSAQGWPYKVQRVRYGWATKLFDHFSVLSHPGTDFLPNTGPDNTNVAGSQATKNLPDPNTAANTPEENAVPIEGLININTAPWQVLATIPWVMDTSDPRRRIPDRAACDRVAKAIVYFRDVDDGLNPVSTSTDPHPHGPFRSILELALIPAVREAWHVDGSTSLELYDGNNAPNVYAGDFSPLVDGESDRGGYDFERKFLNVTRVSNLLTTRSDCFTVYLQVQGWRDAGTADAKMVVQRRLAFIVDRSQVTPTKRQAKIYNIATSQ